MLTRKQYEEEEKECASMLGMTLQEYRNSLKNPKICFFEEDDSVEYEYDNSILELLGVDESILLKQNKN